jgi:hypothetical protein
MRVTRASTPFPHAPNQVRDVRCAAGLRVLLLVAGFGIVLTLGPAVAGSIVAATAAVAWAIWLDRHPDAVVASRDDDREL